MCKYCKEDVPILEKEVIDSISWGWGGDLRITEDQASRTNLVVLIDRGFLRIADKDDMNCLDHGEKIKIHFCPFCGEKTK